MKYIAVDELEDDAFERSVIGVNFLKYQLRLFVLHLAHQFEPPTKQSDGLTFSFGQDHPAYETLRFYFSHFYVKEETCRATYGNENQSVQKFKMIIIGDGGVGKTMYCKTVMQQLANSGDKNYMKTLSVDVNYYRLSFQDSNGEPCSDYGFNIWDTSK